MSLNEVSTEGDVIRSHENQDIGAKFKTYRLNSEFSERKLKEAKIVIDRLNDEINLSRDVEKTLRKQVSLSQNRLIQLQQSLHELTVISEQQRENTKTAQSIEQKIEELDELVKSACEQTRNLVKKTSEEFDTAKENEELKATLKTIEVELNSAKFEIQTLRKEKFLLEVEYKQKIQTIQEDLEKTKLECFEREMQYDETLLIYKKQIQENEEIIKDYERDRRSLLEEFEPPKTEKDLRSCVNVAWADSTVSINADERKQRKENNTNQEDTGNTKDVNALQLFSSSGYSEAKSPTEKRSKKETSQKFPRTGIRQKPQLEFLSQSTGSSQNPTDNPPKWRLFSTNYNHYIN